MTDQTIVSIVPPITQIVVTEPKKRICSFKNKPANTLDEIEVEMPNGKIQTFTIPATQLTNYWAILRFMYTNCNRKVYTEEFCYGVAEIMETFNPQKWEDWKNKKTIKTVKDEGVIQQDAKNWMSRLVTNARNLCRVGGNNPYGIRLTERGHAMQYWTERDGNGYFILLTEINQRTLEKRRRGRKPRISVVVGA